MAGFENFNSDSTFKLHKAQLIRRRIGKCVDGIAMLIGTCRVILQLVLQASRGLHHFGHPFCDLAFIRFTNSLAA
jgi:hypothetical protein